MSQKDKYIQDIQSKIEMLDKLVFLDNGEQKTRYINSLKTWLVESTTKNYFIKENPKKEIVHRYKQNVYWIDFGVNIGSEFNYPHFAVVLKEFKYTAIVIPLSTIKEDDPEWKSAGNYIIDIGCIKDMPNEKKPCYALVNQIKTVSKQRLSDYKYQGKFYSIKLDDDQMKVLCEAIGSLGKFNK